MESSGALTQMSATAPSLLDIPEDVGVCCSRAIAIQARADRGRVADDRDRQAADVRHALPDSEARKRKWRVGRVEYGFSRRRSVCQSEYGQDANPSSALVEDNQRTGRQIGLMLLQSRNDRLFQRIAQCVLRADLEYAGSGRVGKGKHSAEVQIVG